LPTAVSGVEVIAMSSGAIGYLGDWYRRMFS
jgi:hypothetical protein